MWVLIEIKNNGKYEMKFLIPTVIISVILLFPLSGTQAMVFGGSNLGFMGYPDHECTPPYSKPYKPYSFSDQYQIDTYNAEVEQYNSEMRRYRDCIREYVENAKNDIQRVREKANEAINQSNSQ